MATSLDTKGTNEMNRADRERIANENFYNRNISVLGAVTEAIALVAIFAVVVALCLAM